MVKGLINRRTWYIAGASLAFIGLLIVAISARSIPVSASPVVVQGSVQLQDGTGVAGVTIEFHTGNGSFFVTTTTDGSGNYSFTDTLTAGIDYTVEMREPTGYNQLGDSMDGHFTYQAGDAARTVNFVLIPAVKTITGHVYDDAGGLITDADIILTPYNISGASNVGVHTDGSGAYSATVVGGTWFAEAAVNLSDTNFTQRWISEEQPYRMDFASNATVETATHDFHVTTATGRVTVQLLNSDGSYLTTSNFTADIDFRRADGVGTKRKVRAADSVVSVYLTPGIYSIAAYHQDLNGKSFDPAKTTFTITDGSDINLGTVYAEVNAAHLKGKITDTRGRAVSNMTVEAIRDNGGLRPTARTATDGTYDITVGAGTWLVSAKIDDGHRYNQAAPVTATVTNGATASGLNFQVKALDKTITGSVQDSSGNKLTGYVGTAFVTTINKKYKEAAAVVDGEFSIQYSSDDIAGGQVYVGVEASDGSAYTGSGLAKVSISGSRATKNITVKAYNSTLNGTLQLVDGTVVVNAGSDITIEAVDESGNFTSAAVGGDGAFSLRLAAGTWYYDYVIEHPEDTDGLINRPAAQNTITIGSGQTKTAVVTVVKGTNIITGRVTNASGNPVASASISIDNRPTVENSASLKPSAIISVTVLTDELGVYSARVPNGTYLVTAGSTTDTGSSIAPDGKTVTVSGASTTTVNLAFEASNATVTGQVTTNGKADGGGIINAYSDNGKEASATVNSRGNYTLHLSRGDNWHIVATDIKGDNLYESARRDIKPSASSTKINLALKDSGIDVPGPVTKTCDADNTCSASLPDGASVTVPAFGIDLTGTVQLTITPVIDLDRSALDTPATLTYEVKALDGDGYEVKNLKKDAEITVPYDQSEMATDGLMESRLTTTYYDPNTKTWADNGASGLVNTKSNLATIHTSHLTKFSVTGTVKPVPKVSGVTLIGVSNKVAQLSVVGSNFKGRVSAKIGSLKASKVTVKGNALKVYFSTARLNGTYSLVVTSGNGRSTTVSKIITVKNNGVTIKK